TAEIPGRKDVGLFSDGQAISFNPEPLRAGLSFSQSRNQPRGRPIRFLRSAESFTERNYRRRFLRSAFGSRVDQLLKSLTAILQKRLKNGMFGGVTPRKVR
ncbi:unnamed protein product, partial [Ixodes persulcatus]